MQVKLKMATADDEMTTDIIIEGDPEEIDRFRKVSRGHGALVLLQAWSDLRMKWSSVSYPSPGSLSQNLLVLTAP